MQVADLSALPAPSNADYLVDDGSRVLRPLDRVRIDVFEVSQLSREVQVNGSGTIDFPLIGSVNANGRTAQEIGSEIEARLRSGEFVLDPEVSVDVISRSGQNFTVGGQVNKPGRYDLTGPTTLLQAVSIGGGTTEFAQSEEVLVFRTIDGERYIGAYNLAAISRGNYDDPVIHSQDIVMVGDSPAKRLLDRLSGLSSLLTTPIILIDRVGR